MIIIPARAGSQRIPDKNFKPINGKSPLLRTMELAVSAGLGRVIVTSDAPDRVPQIEGVTTIPRWGSLAQDSTPMLDVVINTLQAAPPAVYNEPIYLLQPTAILRRATHLRRALLLFTPNLTSAVSVVADYRGNYRRDGTFYVFTSDTLKLYGDIYGTRTLYVPIPSAESVNLDTPVEWDWAERELMLREGDHRATPQST